MKKILFLSLVPIISFAQSDISNFWKNDSWRTDQIITHKSNSFHIYRIVEQDSDRPKFNYGTFLNFNAEVLLAQETLPHVVMIAFVVHMVPLKKLMKHIYDYKLIYSHKMELVKK